MDWDTGGGIATLVTLKSGDTSLYLDSGGGIIGGFAHDSVKKVASRLLEQGQRDIQISTRIVGIPSPLEGTVRFFFLTTAGTWAGQDSASNVENGSSPWTKCFARANDVITELRKIKHPAVSD
jgi:hypothetical protein